MTNSLELWESPDKQPSFTEKFLAHLPIEWQIGIERQKAAHISNQLARLVLSEGEKTAGVWYKWSFQNSEGNVIELNVSDLNNHGRNLDAIIQGGNQNDRLEIHLQALSIDFYAGSTWALPQKRLDWLRGHPRLATSKPHEWFTWFPPHWEEDKDTSTKLEAYRGYVKFLQFISQVIVGQEMPQLEE